VHERLVDHWAGWEVGLDLFSQICKKMLSMLQLFFSEHSREGSLAGASLPPQLLGKEIMQSSGACSWCLLRGVFGFGKMLSPGKCISNDGPSLEGLTSLS